jgi:hypothetical protein
MRRSGVGVVGAIAADIGRGYGTKGSNRFEGIWGSKFAKLAKNQRTTVPINLAKLRGLS